MSNYYQVVTHNYGYNDNAMSCGHHHHTIDAALHCQTKLEWGSESKRKQSALNQRIAWAASRVVDQDLQAVEC